MDQCAWGGRLQRRVWPVLKPLSAAAGNCVSAEAIAWRDLASHLHLDVPVWQQGRDPMVVKAGSDEQRTILSMRRNADGQWSATYWRWLPSTRPATRAWQARQWTRIDAAAGAATANPVVIHPHLYKTWLASTRGRPSMVDGERWVWSEGTACLSMRTEGISQAQLKLPYSRDDTRLEQRAAMQVQLARKIPGAQWLIPFSLIAPGPDGNRGGAKFLAIWTDQTQLHGQVWMPQKDSEDIARARISMALPAGTRAANGKLAPMTQLMERELVRFAYAWESLNE